MRTRSRTQRQDVPDSEELSSSSAKGNVGTSKVMYLSLAQHGIVLQFALAKRRAVTSNEDELGYSSKSVQGTFSASRSSPRRDSRRKKLTLARPHLLQRRLVAQSVFSRLDNEGQTSCDRLGRFSCLGFFSGGHCCRCRRAS